MFQNGAQNSLELMDDPKAAAVDEIAAKLGLCKVGLYEIIPHLQYIQNILVKQEYYKSFLIIKMVAD